MMMLHTFADMMTGIYWETVGRAIGQVEMGVPGVFVKITPKSSLGGPDYYWISTSCSVFGYCTTPSGHHTVAWRYKFNSAKGN